MASIHFHYNLVKLSKILDSWVIQDIISTLQFLQVHLILNFLFEVYSQKLSIIIRWVAGKSFFTSSRMIYALKNVVHRISTKKKSIASNDDCLEALLPKTMFACVRRVFMVIFCQYSTLRRNCSLLVLRFLFTSFSCPFIHALYKGTRKRQ